MHYDKFIYHHNSKKVFEKVQKKFVKSQTLANFLVFLKFES